MSRKLLVSAFSFLVVMAGAATSACTAIESHKGASQRGEVAAEPLVQLPEGTASVEYSEVTDLPPDAKAQTITFKDATGQVQGFGLRAYPNDGHLPLISWISKKWGPGRLPVLRSCRSLVGDCVVVDSTTYQTNESTPQPDFPILAVVAAGGRVVVVNRLNGTPSQTSDILDLLGVVRQ